MSKIIGIVGCRKRDTEDDYLACLEKFEEIYEEGDQIVSGGCPQGGDRFAERIAKDKGLTIIIYYPRWRDEYGNFIRSAGFDRNTYIAETCDILIAVVSPDRKGGTEDTIAKALRMGKQVYLVMPLDARQEELDDSIFDE